MSIFLLAMDHRDSLERDVYGFTADPTPEQAAQIVHGKSLIFDGLLAAIDTAAGGSSPVQSANGGQATTSAADAASAGVLVDERFGAQVARRAHERGVDLAMPIEKSGQKHFTLEYGTITGGEWLDHIADFDPDQVKLLVRDNPDDAPDAREKQFEDLALVSELLAEAARSFIIELLVPASPSQLASVDGDVDRYDRDVRPALTARVITEFQQHKIEPTIWKIEGLETTEAAELIVRTARQGGRDEVCCIVLGRDAPADRLDHWLTIAAPVEGFIGFAIGRSIWEQPLRDHLAGGSEQELVAAVARNYRRFADTYAAASALPEGSVLPRE
ncbi:2-deoxy-5-keto-D-gluconate 6-phosphate aldolase domain-containing protein [Lacisediminihabitans changchengi]|uniref:DUF2090 domain-containing protein n=1 Tax=Lacisediminihabitans changchengi TaxID=2787634 RepID=A0A934SJU1_9MICO|nr:DUF2090 domain-containing protein [Lacisediminihabitans changchengi]MBK4346631.1 DUF2090 domain-containing protein [Lacisediminihabitans changchengi]